MAHLAQIACSLFAAMSFAGAFRGTESAALVGVVGLLALLVVSVYGLRSGR